MEYLAEDYDYAGGRREGQLASHLYVKKGSKGLSPETIKQVQDDTIRGVALAQRVDSRCPTLQVLLVCPDEGNYFCYDSMRVSAPFLQALPKSRSAGVVHEALHHLQKDYHFSWDDNGEALPQLAEFLFTGNDRLGNFYKLYQQSFVGECSSPHAIAWRSMRLILGDAENSENLEQRYQALLEKTGKMPEDEKVALVKKAIEMAEK